MKKWIWIAPLILAAGCSKTNYQPAAATAVPGSDSSIAQPTANPEPVAPAAVPQATTAEEQQTPSPAAAPAAPPPVGYASGAPASGAIIPRGAHVRVRIDREVDTHRNRPGDRFSATLYEPVVIGGATVLPVGTRFQGHVVAAKPSGRFRGRAVLGLALDSFRFNGRDYHVETSGAYRESRSHKRRNFAFIGGAGGFGAAIGAIAGGGAGAAVGALAGTGAGAAGAAITGKKQVAVAAEAPLIFTLRAAVRI